MTFRMIFIFDLESDLDMTLGDLGYDLGPVGDLDCDLALPTSPPSQVSPSCNFEVIQSMQQQKQLVYINQHMSSSIKFARSPPPGNAGILLHQQIHLSWLRIDAVYA